MSLRYFIFILIFSFQAFAQEDTDELIIKNAPKDVNTFEMNLLAPATATFYSAILPGLGQAFNKKYWVIPVIYAGLGTSVYFYKRNDNKYKELLNAYKLELAGKPHDFENFDISAIESSLKGYKKDRDLSMFIAIGIYVLNIVEANVDAHLPNGKINTNISFRPTMDVDILSNSIQYGLSLKYRFN
ncbi:MAG: DUF5683 domain-containing protein [Flavobacteriaceae bacterium]